MRIGFVVAFVVACALAGCWTQQAVVTPPVVHVDSPPREPPADWRDGTDRVVPWQPCASAAPFVVQGTNKSRLAVDLCRAFERAWEGLSAAPSIKTGVFEIEFVLREATVRPATGLVQCDLSMTIVVPKGPSHGAVTKAETADECAHDLLVVMLPDIVEEMEKKLAAMATP